MILVFDTETSNLPQNNIPLDHPAQARIVQFGCLMLDENFKERASFCSLIKPDGWQIQPGAQSVHGISQEECIRYGLPIEQVFDMFFSLYHLCDIKVAHNKRFDGQLINIECSLLSKFEIDTDEHYCTMQLMTPICQLPSKRGGYKWPKLAEAYKHCTGHEMVNAHGALADCRATAEIFKWLCSNKHVSIAQLVIA